MTVTGPITSLIPHSPTMLRASSVACLMSILGAGGDLAVDEFLGDPAAERHLDLAEQVRAGRS